MPRYTLKFWNSGSEGKAPEATYIDQFEAENDEAARLHMLDAVKRGMALDDAVKATTQGHDGDYIWEHVLEQ